MELLDDLELRAIEEFFEGTQGEYGHFAFTDPCNGVEYPDCSLDQEVLEMTWEGEMRGRSRLMVRENRH